MTNDSPKANQLTEYKLADLGRDIGAIQAKLDGIYSSLSKFGERVGRTESRIDVLYWLIGLAVPTTSALTGVIISLIK